MRKVHQIVRQVVKNSNGLGQSQTCQLGQLGYSAECNNDCRTDPWGNLLDVVACNDCLLKHQGDSSFSLSDFFNRLFSW